MKKGWKLKLKTHCHKGHEFTTENTGRDGEGFRVCLACKTALKIQKLKGKPPGLSNEAKKALTHCKHGHKYTEANTYHHPNAGRVCRICKRLDQKNFLKDNPTKLGK